MDDREEAKVDGAEEGEAADGRLGEERRREHDDGEAARGQRSQLLVREREARRLGTHLKIQLLMVETALAAVRVLIGLTSAGYNHGSLLNRERARGCEREGAREEEEE